MTGLSYNESAALKSSYVHFKPIEAATSDRISILAALSLKPTVSIVAQSDEALHVNLHSM